MLYANTVAATRRSEVPGHLGVVNEANDNWEGWRTGILTQGLTMVQ